MAEGLRESEGECGHKHVLPLLNGGKNGSTYKWNPTGTQGGELSGCLGYISTVRPPTQVVSPNNPPPKQFQASSHGKVHRSNFNRIAHI
ncbi:hypothetical protein CesoFtcFv8_000625 [Champsocephalus esox]|uniref:Uncharacterized protein n=1 Tax=Champsocephalus esox TaxID=159716 RepID=A0AAN8D1T4_9TELE|nr:hypothetical protein CesoFtcFv8_000625 [Champsocephalus esox]